MSLFDNLVDSRRQRLEKLRSNNNNNSNNKGSETSSPPNIIGANNNDPLTKNIELEDNSIDIQNSDESHETDNEDQENEGEEESNDHPVSVTRDFEMKLDPQFKVLESRTNIALKRILRRQMFQKDLDEEDTNENDQI